MPVLQSVLKARYRHVMAENWKNLKVLTVISSEGSNCYFIVILVCVRIEIDQL